VSLFQYLEIAGGLVIIVAVLYDLFQSIVLPRPAVGKVRLAPYVVRPLWRVWRWVGTRSSRIEKRENRLAAFGPLALFILLAFWGLALILGYALIFDGLRNQIQPPPADFGSALYISGTSILPLSYGDAVPIGVAARIAVMAESASGVGLAALIITLLFSLYASFQAREEAVVVLDALAGAPPSGLHILETAAEQGLSGELARTFVEWKKWSAAVLESHLAYPILLYFRSSHDNEAWLNSFGAVMDAATLTISAIEDDAVGPARLMFKVGNHLVEDLRWYFRFRPASDPIVERSEFDQAMERLRQVGYKCEDQEKAWTNFAALRSQYASTLNQLAHMLAIVPAQWIGDRSYLPHRRE
jgi:hypothetical protein